jgi:hypothetical protein
METFGRSLSLYMIYKHSKIMTNGHTVTEIQAFKVGLSAIEHIVVNIYIHTHTHTHTHTQ